MMNDDNIGRSRMLPPLPERMRPHDLDGYVGQRHLIGKGCILRNMIKDNMSSGFLNYSVSFVLIQFFFSSSVNAPKKAMNK